VTDHLVPPSEREPDPDPLTFGGLHSHVGIRVVGLGIVRVRTRAEPVEAETDVTDGD